MRKAMIAAVLLGLSMPVLANCGNGNGNGEGCENGGGSQGPQGPAGQNGSNGTNGTNGKDGKNGMTPQVDSSAKFALDTAVRLYDGKRVQVQAFNIYTPSRVNNQDTLGDGKNFMFGARVVLKLGPSYEEGLIERQQRDIKALEAALSRLQQ